MWFRKKESVDIEELVEKIKKLKDERKRLKAEIEDLKLKKKIETEDIKHLVKLKEEKQKIQFERKEMELEKKMQETIAEVKNGYRNKVEKNLESQKNDVKEMYGQILKRLPDVNVRLKGDV